MRAVVVDEAGEVGEEAHWLRVGFVRIDHRPTKLPQVWVPVPALYSAPVGSCKHAMGCPPFSFAAIEDDTDIAPVLKVSAQFLVQVQTAAGHYEEEHVPGGRFATDSPGLEPVKIA